MRFAYLIEPPFNFRNPNGHTAGFAGVAQAQQGYPDLTKDTPFDLTEISATEKPPKFGAFAVGTSRSGTGWMRAPPPVPMTPSIAR